MSPSMDPSMDSMSPSMEPGPGSLEPVDDRILAWTDLDMYMPGHDHPGHTHPGYTPPCIPAGSPHWSVLHVQYPEVKMAVGLQIRASFK